MNSKSSLLLTFFFFIFIFPHTLKAIETDSSSSPNCVYINLFQLLQGDINFEYEMFILKKHPWFSVSVESGYRFLRLNQTFNGLRTNTYADLFGYFWSKSAYGSISAKFYFKKHSETKSPYFECSFFVRDNFYKKVLVRYGLVNDQGEIKNNLQSSNEMVYGVKFNWGTKKRYINLSRTIYSNTWFIGFGFRTKYVYKTTYEKTTNYAGTTIYNPPLQENYQVPFSPTLQGGLILGWEREKQSNTPDDE